MPAAVTTSTLAQLLDEALDLLYRHTERPLEVVVGSNALADGADTTLTLNTSAQWDAVNVTDVLEYKQELLLVTAKSADATPVFTVVRQYAGTPLEGGAATNERLLLNPLWKRHSVRQRVVRALDGPLAAHFPGVFTTTIARPTNKSYISAPTLCTDVLQVGYFWTNTNDEDWVDLAGLWRWDPYVGGTNSTGIIKIPGAVPGKNPNGTTLNLTVVHEAPYVWKNADGSTDTDPEENDTVDLPHGGADLPALYAAAYLLTGRELTRLELDMVSEWNHEEAVRRGFNIQIIREAWQTFYRRVDEARRARPPLPKTRAYRKLRRIS